MNMNVLGITPIQISRPEVEWSWIGVFDLAIALGQEPREYWEDNWWAKWHMQESGEPEMSGPEGGLVISCQILCRTCGRNSIGERAELNWSDQVRSKAPLWQRWPRAPLEQYVVHFLFVWVVNRSLVGVCSTMLWSFHSWVSASVCWSSLWAYSASPEGRLLIGWCDCWYTSSSGLPLLNTGRQIFLSLACWRRRQVFVLQHYKDMVRTDEWEKKLACPPY